MAKEKKYYWLKLEKDFFKRHDISIIENMPNGKDYVLFYLKLILESMNHNGELRFSETVPYNNDMLSVITNTNVDIVRSAITIFTELGLMEVWDDETIFIQETNKMVGSETEWAKKKRDYNKRLQVKVDKFELPDTYPYMLGVLKVVSKEQVILPNGDSRFIDEVRYGGNGKIALARSKLKCVNCGVDNEKLVIHHSNGYSNDLEDLKVLCHSCHKKEHREGKSPTDVLEISDKSIEIEKEIELDKKNTSSNKSLTENDFEELWKLYPKKANKKDGLNAYKKAIKNGTTKEEVLNGINKYNEYLRLNKEWLKPMDGGRWFQKERWLDEYDMKGEQHGEVRTTVPDHIGTIL